MHAHNRGMHAQALSMHTHTSSVRAHTRVCVLMLGFPYTFSFLRNISQIKVLQDWALKQPWSFK